LLLTFRARTMSNNQDTAITIRRPYLRSLEPNHVISLTVQPHPFHDVWRSPQINGPASFQLHTHVAQPAPQRLGTSIDPSPRSVKLTRWRKTDKDISFPVRQAVNFFIKTENGLHRIAQHAGRQCIRRASHYAMLADRTILILVHNEARVARSQNVVNVT